MDDLAARRDVTPPPTPAWLDTGAYPFSRRTVTLRRGRMHFVDEGSGPPLLFVHGTPTWSFEFRHLIRELSTSHRCIAPDHLGFGLSERPLGNAYTPEEHAENLREFVDALGLRDFSLVVHDFGGPIGLKLCVDQPERVRDVVVLNSWMWSFEDDREMTRKARIAGGALGRFLYRRFNLSLKVIAPSAYADRKKLTPEIHRQYLSVFPDADSRGRVLWALARALNGSSEYYASLWERRAALADKRVLIVWGLGDSAFPPSFLERWKAALPNAHVVTLEQAGHWPHEEDPEAVLRALTAFLQR